MYNSTIKGLGFYVPENTVTNNDLSELMDTSDEWITERTGIKERRWVNDDKLTTSLMGTYAAERAIIDSGIEKKDIDSKNIAVALNETLIKKSEWNKTKVSENDRIEIVVPFAGG